MPEATRPEPSRLYRWIVLIFVSLAMFGNYYVYDCIAPVADLLAKQLGFSDSNIGLLQAIYSFPNIVMVLIRGYIVDRIGTRLLQTPATGDDPAAVQPLGRVEFNGDDRATPPAVQK